MEVMLEITPPSKRASQQQLASAVNRLATLVKSSGCVDSINIPEITEENHHGQPLYRNIDTREYGILLRKATGKRIIVNRISVYMSSEPTLEAWLDETAAKYGIHDIVLVGGNSPLRKYLGPTVTRANELASKRQGLNIGNICIPDRANELERILGKTKSGCKFFTTQILLESEPACKLLEAYASECKKRNLKPAAFYLSFAPVASMLDIELFKWFGVAFPPETETRLLKSQDLGKESVLISNEVFSEILRFANEHSLGVPLHLNVEAIMMQNLHLAEEMLNTIKPK
ncbi:hypothetical protein COT30_04515 [Candidatus Micrarchaeota archaeon CG08_land_8_20_14_0_20_49_17]|nr:MAG: hypothetical protein AUJ13_05735 [Candidatus Micrarchaeota archaeon CG1_02_49_24]PIU09430.1 MAG: hypothetical protein COT30_04515 [Candidatus Micrarchaeota archaeon CG08_land_8_20_14_0_20_49_17]PIU82509.1 MAG: hypothetical protein COS70_00930 [Candidatus Micrarchaeota archaeon CG06_land_8_20_14_3_00_50_6]PIZ92494.1 MAG: hypothetical protein COX84_06705 [Candidatus Micrarchaeota archaeon CG_4_10_14_0_2_um_filter_49_7]HII53882.1 hypothetical protein [Candidatus Micrarchaeota archaeon]